MSDATQIDCRPFGLLKVVNTERRHSRCKGHRDTIECIFDTGVVMYLPPALFDVALFALDEDDGAS